jgi:hypothetical protein
MSSETGRVNESLVFDHKMESAVFIRKKKEKKTRADNESL